MSSPETNAALERSFDIFTKDSDTVMMLMDVEETLRSSGKADVADKLDKLQRDITGWYAFADTPTSKPGEITQSFVTGYEAITPARLNSTLRDINSSLPGGDLKRSFGEFMLATIVPEAPAVAVKPAVKKLGR